MRRMSIPFYSNTNWKPGALLSHFHLYHLAVSPSYPSAKLHFRDRDNRTRIKITQFPCVLSSVLTGHKVQGNSVDSIILGSMSSHHRYGANGWLYVVLSRARQLRGLFLLEPVESDSRKYKPRHDVMDEMTRLRRF